MTAAKLFPQDSSKIEPGTLIKLVDNNEYYTFGSKKKSDESQVVKYELGLYENCIIITLLLDGTTEFHYEYHEDIFNSGNYEMFDQYILDLQLLVFKLWNNTNYNGYITNHGIELRDKFIKTQSKL